MILLHDDDTDTSQQSAKLREIIQRSKQRSKPYPFDLERDKWTIKYLEKRNKHLEYKQAIMELQNICENRQAAQRRRIEITSLEQEINEDRGSNIERVNIHLERLLDKADKEHAFLRHMAFHYMARNKVCKA